MARKKNSTFVVKTKRKKSQDFKKIDNVSGLDSNVKGIAILVISVLVFFAIFYGITVFLVNKNEKAAKVDPTISYSEILVGRSLSMSDEEYLVLYYDASAADSYVYSSLLSDYEGEESHLPIYYADLSNAFNKKYFSETESNSSPSSVNDLLFNGPTLIRVQNGQVVDYFEGEVAITDYFNKDK